MTEVTPDDLCAICEGVFIDHYHGALGHDWRPKAPVIQPPKVELSNTEIAIAQTAATARGLIHGY